MLADDGDWPGAAAAFTAAVTASDLRYYASVSAAGREADTRARGNLSPWASYVLARAGDPEGAAVVVEDGRTRELRLRLGAGDEQRAALKDAAPRLCGEYDRALADIARAELVDDADAAAVRYRRALDEIRAIPGLERFGGRLGLEALTAAAAIGEPVVYINPTPWGTVILTVQPEGTVRSRFLGVTSTTVTARLMYGVDENGHQTPPSYLAAAVGDGTGVQRALALTLSWVGETLAAVVADELRIAGADAPTLVPCGLLGHFPLHVAPWITSDGATQTLADEFDMKFAPSASLHAAARQRHQARAISDRRPTLVAIADPTTGDRPLPASRDEVAAIAARFDPAHRHVAVGADATSTFLRCHAPQATYLHLACHAYGAIFDFRASHLSLSDGDLPLTELSRIGPLTSRLAVASACQTAVPDAALADEAYSIGAILLASGATGAIASFWPVDDLATALLMIKLYEALFDYDQRPSQALRHAQTWLRDLSRAEAEAIIADHQALSEEASRRHAAAEGILPDGTQPFADPSYWAAFVVMGI